MNDLLAFMYGYLDIEFPGQSFPEIPLAIVGTYVGHLAMMGVG